MSYLTDQSSGLQSGSNPKGVEVTNVILTAVQATVKLRLLTSFKGFASQIAGLLVFTRDNSES